MSVATRGGRHVLLTVGLLASGLGHHDARAQNDDASNAGGDVPDVRVEVHRPAELYDGYLFWHRTDEIGADFENYSVLVDNEGSVVHRWETDISGGGVSAYVLEGGRILRDDTVKGGTGWGAEFAKLCNKPLYVFDQDKDGWFHWTGEGWEAEAEPRVTHPHFAGTGTRFLEANGQAAIDALFERSFG